MNWAKEIHAYQNEDGTYRIEMLGDMENPICVGMKRIKEITESKVEIGRAAIKIIGYSVALSEPTIFTLEIKD